MAKHAAHSSFASDIQSSLCNSNLKAPQQLSDESMNKSKPISTFRINKKQSTKTFVNWVKICIVQCNSNLKAPQQSLVSLFQQDISSAEILILWGKWDIASMQ